MDDPAAMRRRLRVEMKRLRKEAKLTQRQVATELEWSPSKIIRIESGEVGLNVTDLKALAGLYGVREDDALGELLRLARGSRKQPYAAYKDVLSPETIKFVGYEASASLIRHMHPLLVPGLLQTPRYTRALLGAFGYSTGEINRILETRAKRQEIFDRSGDREFFFILDEAVLHRLVGGVDVMDEQLEHLLTVSRRSQTTIQVIPFERGAYDGMRGSFVHLEFPNPNDPDVLFIENMREGISFYSDDAATTGRYQEIFFGLEDIAASSGELAEYIARVRAGIQAGFGASAGPS